MSDEQKAPPLAVAAGTLYIVSTPIGNDDDITLRATRILKHCDVIACEEIKIGAKILKRLNVSAPIIELNEHTEDYANDEVIAKLIGGENVALISDCGTPIFADPGQGLLKRAFAASIPVVVVPGVTSIMTALTRSGLPTNSFVYAGFMSRKPEERREQLRQIAAEIRTVVFLETPYRVVPLLAAIAEIMPTRRTYVGCNLTMPFESHHYGSVAEIAEKLMAEKFKGEAVICIEGAPSEIRGGIRRKVAVKPTERMIAIEETEEEDDRDETQEFGPDNDEFPEMRSQNPQNDSDDETEIDFDAEDEIDDDIEIDFDAEDEIDDDIEIDFDAEDEIDDDIEIDFDAEDEDEKSKHGPTKPRFDNKPRPGYNPKRFSGDDGRGFDDRKPRFGGERDGGGGGRRFDDRKPRFGGERDGSGGGRRFDDRKPRFGGERDGGGGGRRFDDRKPRFGGEGDGGGGGRRFDDRKPRFGGERDGGGGGRRFDDRKPRFGGEGDGGGGGRRFDDRKPRFGGEGDGGGGGRRFDDRKPRFGGERDGGGGGGRRFDDRKPRFGGERDGGGGGRRFDDKKPRFGGERDGGGGGRRFDDKKPRFGGNKFGGKKFGGKRP